MSDTFFVQPVGVYTASANGPVGHQVRVNGKRWCYVQFLDAVTYLTGHVCSPATTTSSYKVTNDVSGGTSALATMFAGAIPNVDAQGNTVTAVPAQNDYGYVQLDGYHSAIRTNGDDDIAAWDTLIMVATDGVVDSVGSGTTTGTLKQVGFAATADVDADNTVAAWLRCLCW